MPKGPKGEKRSADVIGNAAGVSDRLWSMEDMVALIDAQAEPPMKRGPYKPRTRKAGTTP